MTTNELNKIKIISPAPAIYVFLVPVVKSPFCSIRPDNIKEKETIKQRKNKERTKKEQRETGVVRARVRIEPCTEIYSHGSNNKD